MPVQQPLRRKRNRFITVPATPMAAKAVSPAKRPMTMASMVLYSCWRMFPKIRGRASDTSWGGMEPRVRAAVSTACHLTVSSGEIRIAQGETVVK